MILQISKRWLRGQDLNVRPSGYEPDELPDCSTPRHLMFQTGFKPTTAKHAMSENGPSLLRDMSAMACCFNSKRGQSSQNSSIFARQFGAYSTWFSFVKPLNSVKFATSPNLARARWPQAHPGGDFLCFQMKWMLRAYIKRPVP